MSAKSRDQVDQLAMESFPASDPPSWTATGTGSPHTEPVGDTVDEGPVRSQDQMLLAAIERLEKLLNTGFPGREAEWFKQAALELDKVGACLTVHRAAAEAPNGMYANVDMTRPSLVRIVGKLKADHQEFSDLIEQLTQRVSTLGSDIALAYLQAREKCESLLIALRRHQTDEADIVLDTYNMDFGAGE